MREGVSHQGLTAETHHFFRRKVGSTPDVHVCPSPSTRDSTDIRPCHTEVSTSILWHPHVSLVYEDLPSFPPSVVSPPHKLNLKLPPQPKGVTLARRLRKSRRLLMSVGRGLQVEKDLRETKNPVTSFKSCLLFVSGGTVITRRLRHTSKTTNRLPPSDPVFSSRTHRWTNL